MSGIVIKAENISKKYNLGATGSSSLFQSLGQTFKRLLGKKAEKASSNKEFWALRDVSFEINQGDVVGIVGRNGAGKSTLLKVLSRITAPTTGKIEVQGRIASLLEVGTGFHPELSGKENIFLNGAILGMSKQEIKQKFDEIVEFSAIERFLDTPVKRYSSGMYVRLAFAVAAHLDPEILIIDEVLAVGDAEFQKKCLGKMNAVASSGRTVLFVSHNMATVKSLCNKGIYMQQGSILQIGNLEDTIGLYMNQAKISKKHYENGVVRYISVKQVEQTILLELHYQCDFEITLPNVIFTIHDADGYAIAGMGPRQDAAIVENGTKLYPKQGKVFATISQPQLLDGNYSFSIYFGDKTNHFFHELNCISLEIIGMTHLQQLYKTNLVGSVVPQCTFSFE